MLKCYSCENTQNHSLSESLQHRVTPLGASKDAFDFSPIEKPCLYDLVGPMSERKIFWNKTQRTYAHRSVFMVHMHVA